MRKPIIAAAALALGATTAFAPTAQADGHTLADILLADDAESGELNVFDDDQNDFDIVTAALLATDGLNGLATAAGTEGANVTVFLPTDKAFRILVEDLLGVSIKDEAELFAALADDTGPVGVATVSAVLQYHVVPLVADSATVRTLGDGAEVPTVLGPTVELDFKGTKQIRLVDDGGPGRDPIVRVVDITASNGIAHVIDRVLIPG